MTELEAFIEARIADDEESPWPHRLTCQMAARTPGLAMSCNCDAAERWWRDISIKRQILGQYASHRDALAELEAKGEDNASLAAIARALWFVLVALAGSWSDHPDYRAEWATT